MDQMLSGEEIDHSLRKRWLRKRGSDFQVRLCLVVGSWEPTAVVSVGTLK